MPRVKQAHDDGLWILLQYKEEERLAKSDCQGVKNRVKKEHFLMVMSCIGWNELEGRLENAKVGDVLWQQIEVFDLFWNLIVPIFFWFYKI